MQIDETVHGCPVTVVHLIVRLEILALQVKSAPPRDRRLWLRPAGRAMSVSLVQTKGSRRAAGKVRHATRERTSEAGPRAGLFEAADRAVGPQAKDEGGQLPVAGQGRP